jgi:hypothetical protein
MSNDDHALIDGQLQALRTMPIRELRVLWRTTFKSEPPRAFGPDLLRRSIAYKRQEIVYGGLDRPIARLMQQLMAQFARTGGRIVLPRQIKPGAVLVREWKGERYLVEVTEDGYLYEGKPYESLSEIARLITGTRWNGPRFFGLRERKANGHGHQT